MTQRDARYWRRTRRVTVAVGIFAVGAGLLLLLMAISYWSLARRVEAEVARLAARDPADPALGEGQELIARTRRGVHSSVLCAGLVFAAAFLSIWQARRAGRELRRLIGQCVKCGYDLRGLPEPRCPECGTAFNLKEYPDLSAPRPVNHSE